MKTFDTLVVFALFLRIFKSNSWYVSRQNYQPQKQMYPRSNNQNMSSVIWTHQNVPETHNSQQMPRQLQEGVDIQFNNQKPFNMEKNLDYEHHERLCTSLNGFTKRQRHLCLKFPGLIWVMGEGATLGLTECIHQFKHEKWNCSSAGFILENGSLENTSNLNTNNIDKGLSRLLEKGSKERAFLSATWAAGSVDKLTRACSTGSIQGCRCDPRRDNNLSNDIHGQFYWSGCSDHITFGMRLTRRFLESVDHQYIEEGEDVDENSRRRRFSEEPVKGIDTNDLEIIEKKAKSFMNIHNTKVGINAVWQHRRKECRCNGPSGTCTIRFCFHKIGNFRNVGNFIKRAYESAIRVSYKPEQNRLVTSESLNWKSNQIGIIHNNLLLNRNARFSRNYRGKRENGGLSKKVLVYLEDSPNYCKPDNTIGHPGIKGRECDGNNSTAPNSCSTLCCNHGHETLVIEQPIKCRCKFIWCCEVKCQVCLERKTIHRCKDSVGGQFIPRPQANQQFSKSYFSLQ